MLFSTPGISQFIGGVILQDETIRQNASTGMPLVELAVWLQRMQGTGVSPRR